MTNPKKKDDKKTIKVSVDDEKDTEQKDAECPEGQERNDKGDCVAKPQDSKDKPEANLDSDTLAQIKELLHPKTDSKETELDKLKKEYSGHLDSLLTPHLPKEVIDSMCFIEKKGALKTLQAKVGKKDSPIIRKGAPYVPLNPGKRGKQAFDIEKDMYNFTGDPMGVKSIDKDGNVFGGNS